VIYGSKWEDSSVGGGNPMEGGKGSNLELIFAPPQEAAHGRRRGSAYELQKVG